MGLLLNLSLDHQFKSGQNSPGKKKPSKEGEIKKKNLMKSYSGEIALPGQTDVQ